jgi:HK97 family phage prohead protease
MEKRDFSFKVKSFDAPDGSFEGDLAVYGNEDLGGDVIQPGAFARSIKANGSQIPLLWQHRPDEPIGTLILNDTPGSLQVKGQLLLDLPMAQKARVLLKAKIVKGLSIGYDTIVEDYVGGTRHLKELRLWEGSVVTFPMNPLATVTAIKTLDDPEDEQEEVDALQQIYNSLLRLGSVLKP